MGSISIIGAGNMARALAARALAGGNSVEIIARDRAKAEALTAELDGATVGSVDGVPTGDVVVLAVLHAGAAAVVSGYGDRLDGKVVVDITNPVAPDLSGLVAPDGSSGAQEIAKAASPGAHVVKAFNTLFANVVAAEPVEGRPVDVFVAGDDAPSKELVSTFIESLGLRPMDAGPLAMARALEYAGLLEISLVNNTVKHTDFALGVTVLR